MNKQLNYTSLQLSSKDHQAYPRVSQRWTQALICMGLSYMWSCIEEPPQITRDPGESQATESEDTGLEPLEDQGQDAQVFTDQMLRPELDLGLDSSIIDLEDAELDQRIDSEFDDLEVDATIDMDVGDWPELELPLPIAEVEQCDGVDNDLDALIDEGLSNPCGGCEPLPEGSGCVGWRAGLIETQVGSGALVESVSEGELDPNRIIALSAAILEYEEFELEGAKCARIATPQSWEGGSSIGDVTLTTPQADLTFLPHPQQRGRYQALGESEPFVVHRAGDRINLNWEGWNLDSMSSLPVIEEGMLTLTSPPLVQLATTDELRAVIDAFQRPEDPEALDELVTIRWIAEPLETTTGLVAGLPLELYVGGSQSLFQRGAYRAIRHYLLSATLFDDGRLDLALPTQFRAPGSSIWVYLERVERAQVVSGVNPVRAQVGHRTELRASAAGGAPSTPSTLTLNTPDPEGAEPDVTIDGLAMSWTIASEAPPPEQVAISLILYDAQRTEQLICLLNDVTQTTFQIPPTALTFWPQSPESVRQLTIRADTKRLQFSAPDKGFLRRSDSVILRLSDL